MHFKTLGGKSQPCKHFAHFFQTYGGKTRFQKIPIQPGKEKMKDRNRKRYLTNVPFCCVIHLAIGTHISRGSINLIFKVTCKKEDNHDRNGHTNFCKITRCASSYCTLPSEASQKGRAGKTARPIHPHLWPDEILYIPSIWQAKKY